MKWKYHRGNQVSKWVCGRNWVTKFDDEDFCIIGINGEHWTQIDSFFKKPKLAREYIENAFKKLWNQGSALTPFRARCIHSLCELEAYSGSHRNDGRARITFTE